MLWWYVMNVMLWWHAVMTCYDDMLWWYAARSVVMICYDGMTWWHAMMNCYDDMLACYDDMLWSHAVMTCYDDMLWWYTLRYLYWHTTRGGGRSEGGWGWVDCAGKKTRTPHLGCGELLTITSYYLQMTCYDDMWWHAMTTCYDDYWWHTRRGDEVSEWGWTAPTRKQEPHT